MRKSNREYEDYDLGRAYEYVYDDDAQGGEDLEGDALPSKTKRREGKSGGTSPAKVIAAAAIAAVLAGAGGFAAGHFLMGGAGASQQAQLLQSELDSLNKTVYVASRDISAGENLSDDGPSANIKQEQIKTAADVSSVIDGVVDGYVQIDIKAGTPVYNTMIGPNDPTAAIEPERITEEVPVPEVYEFPYHITAEYVDATGEKIAEPNLIELAYGVSEQSFSDAGLEMNGYKLTGIKIGDVPVHSFGCVKKEVQGGEIVMIYYYTDETGLIRYQILDDLTVTYIFEPAQEEEPVAEGADQPAEGTEQPAEGAEGQAEAATEAEEAVEEVSGVDAAAASVGIPIDDVASVRAALDAEAAGAEEGAAGEAEIPASEDAPITYSDVQNAAAGQ